MTRWDASPFEQACIWSGFFGALGLGYLYLLVLGVV